MNKAFHLLCLGGFLLLPVVVLLFRIFRPKLMPWWLVFVVVAVAGWLLVNGEVYFYFEHLSDLMRSYGDSPPDDLVERWTNDGAKRVFALFFGWVYALIYFIPALLIYGFIQFLRRNGRA